jgi:hypothetical protein
VPIYLHEIIRVTPGREEDYMASVLSLGSMPGRKGTAGHSGQLGLFRTAEHAGPWPKVVNIWEHNGWGGLTGSLARQFQDTARDSKMEDWWRANTDLRAGGHDRVLLPTPATRDRSALARDGVRGRVFVHEIASLPLGETPRYLERLDRDLRPAAASLGWELVGAYRVAWRPREALTLWALREWRDLGRLEEARAGGDAAIRDWFAYRDGVVRDLDEMVLLPGRMNPLAAREA